MTLHRETTKVLSIGKVKIGGGNPIAIQSMTNTDTRDANATLEQIKRLHEAGCEIARVAVPNMDAAKALSQISANSPLPIVADVHFDYRLAVASAKYGANKLRINPGNIGATERVREVARAAEEYGIPIRVGANGGSTKRKGARGLAKLALEQVEIFETVGFYNIVLAVKSSNVSECIEANEILARQTNYPIHIGVTEAGGVKKGAIKSAVGLGAILASGVGDTIRVSLTGDPVEEISVARDILSALGLRKFGPELISCPTCSRVQSDVIKIASQIEKELENIKTPIKVAVMGCAVNGPGEASDADVGVACGKGMGLIFANGKKIKSVPEENITKELLEQIKSITA